MKTTALLFITLSSLMTGVLHAAQPLKLADSRPNILFILTDDQGKGDLSCMGNDRIRTPHLDALWAKSTRFDDFHVSPTCSPTRGALMSGRSPFEVGISHTIRHRDHLALDVVTFPQALQKAGYKTGIFGKWHLGDEKEYLPNARGFDEMLIHGAGGIGQAGWGDFPVNAEECYFDNILLHNEEIVQTKGFCTDLFFHAGLAWMKDRIDAKEPYFAYISLNAPHGPMIAPEKYKRRFLDDGYSENSAGRFGMIENIDDNIGLTMAKLKEWNQLENTLVIFMTDNGMAGSVGVQNGQKFNSFNCGMKGAKATVHEGGTRVPSFWHWKGKLKEGIDIDALTAHIDFYRTICQLAGAKIPKSKLPPAGRSLLPLLQNPKAKWKDRTLFFHRGRWNDEIWDHDAMETHRYRNAAARSTQWRWIDNKELYDIGKDPGQQQNVAKKNQEVMKQMKEAYDAWWDTLGPLQVNAGKEQIKKGNFPLQKRYQARIQQGALPLWSPKPI